MFVGFLHTVAASGVRTRVVPVCAGAFEAYSALHSYANKRTACAFSPVSAVRVRGMSSIHFDAYMAPVRRRSLGGGRGRGEEYSQSVLLKV